MHFQQKDEAIEKHLVCKCFKNMFALYWLVGHVEEQSFSFMGSKDLEPLVMAMYRKLEPLILVLTY